MQKGLFSFTKKHFCLVAGLLFVQFSSGQGLINNGAQIVITNTSNIHISGATGNLTNQAGGLIVNSAAGGKITLGGNWVNDAANSVFSGTGSTVEFNGATAQSIGGTNPTAFYNLTASGSGTKTVNTPLTSVSRLVTVSDNTQLDANGNLTLLATSSEHASIGPLINGASVSNNVIVQSYLTGGSDGYRVWKGLSSPINDGLILGNKTYKQLQSKLIITGNLGTTNGFDKGNSASPYGATIKTYNEQAALGTSQFTVLPNITDPVIQGLGFFLYYRGNRTDNYDASGSSATGSKVVAPFATPESVLVDYTGPINQGPIEVNLSYTNNNDSDIFIGTNLVGNPYPSVIDWHAVYNASVSAGADISPVIYVVKQDGSFAEYTITDAGLGTGIGANEGTRYIMPGQAFYVKANAASQKLTFAEGSKDPYPVSGTVMRFLSAPRKELMGLTMATSTLVAPPHRMGLKVLRFNVKNMDAQEEALLIFRDNATVNYDNNEDGLYFSGNPVVLLSKSKDNKNLSINSLPEPTEPTEVDLYVSTSISGKHQLNFTDLSQLGATQVFLEDSFLKKTEPVVTNSIYEFSIDRKIPQSFGGNRFKLVFHPQLNLANFSAKKVYGGSEITWSGASKYNNELFVIERSTDGNVFQTIGAISKDDIGTYRFIDKKPENGLNYYRLKLQDTVKYSYTNVVSLDYAPDSSEPYFKIFPNPVNDALNVIYKDDVKQGQLAIYSLGGQKIKSFSVLNADQSQYNVSDLPTGVYILKAIDGQNKEVGTEKFIKE
ncbi:T9SS type A sorting domain-containing protein [Paradesertivirga mongoliensis]|uniref:T9SS type A sorting domain-containing protein n=1 Tax=Paradesertivirga mongoliensis TaxID=2100740 RepID=A0ABW4ZQK0_9SPHI|nr:T9SS type A sorting domain-containing protein [Pedobacter mongoliensis]